MIGDVGDITQKIFHLTQLSPMCPRACLGDASPTVTIIWKPGFSGSLMTHMQYLSPIQAPSTRIRIFLRKYLLYPCLVHVHTENAFSVTENEAFRKRCRKWIFLKTPFSCGLVDGWNRSFSKTLM